MIALFLVLVGALLIESPVGLVLVGAGIVYVLAR